ncbi:hypothetical protein DENSPDRAFT_3428 [Dentipellis sp. KUC8613]|nr:hypothetical protein DENSPDRAFT_3428 [Dentipellis sp. KUC8613]
MARTDPCEHLSRRCLGIISVSATSGTTARPLLTGCLRWHTWPPWFVSGAPSDRQVQRNPEVPTLHARLFGPEICQLRRDIEPPGCTRHRHVRRRLFKRSGFAASASRLGGSENFVRGSPVKRSAKRATSACLPLGTLLLEPTISTLRLQGTIVAVSCLSQAGF